MRAPDLNGLPDVSRIASGEAPEDGDHLTARIRRQTPAFVCINRSEANPLENTRVLCIVQSYCSTRTEYTCSYVDGGAIRLQSGAPDLLKREFESVAQRWLAGQAARLVRVPTQSLRVPLGVTCSDGRYSDQLDFSDRISKNARDREPESSEMVSARLFRVQINSI